MKEILVIARSALPEEWLPVEGAVAAPWETITTTVEGMPGALRWMARSEAERAPRWKQPIPYLLLRDGDGRVAAYRRGGSERRLHGLWSLGIGGHVERADEDGDLAGTLLRCAARELAEEVPGCDAALRYAGAINEERTEVGSVHWGLVFEARVAHRPAPGPELGELAWLDPREAAALELELWSRLALRLLELTGPATLPSEAAASPAASIRDQERQT